MEQISFFGVMGVSRVEIKYHKSVIVPFTVAPRLLHTPSREERCFLNFKHLSKEFLEQIIPHLKALIQAFRIGKKIGRGIILRLARPP